jgi:hypothetical protein
LIPKRDKTPVDPSSREKGVMANKRPDVSRSSFLRELKRAARGLLDKRSPQD